MRIAFGGIHTECSTYSPLIQQRKDFTVFRGDALTEKLGLEAPADVELLPLSHARSIPGGPVERQVYLDFKQEFLNQLQQTLPVDGVYLAMHGALHVADTDILSTVQAEAGDELVDPEGDWIAAVRQCVGPDVPIAVSYDLHGNVTDKIIETIDIFTAYRTAPHIDVISTHNRALSLLTRSLRSGERTIVEWQPIPVLLPGERTSTEDEPTKSLYEELPLLDQRDGVLDSNLLVGYVWADCHRATASAVVTGTDRAAAKQTAKEIARGYFAAREDFNFGVETASLDTCLAHIVSLQNAQSDQTQTRPIILADSGDNPTGGGVGDRTDVLQAILGSEIKSAVFAGISDAPATRQAANAGIGAELTLKLGGTLGSDCPAVTISAEVIKVCGDQEQGNLEVLIRTGDIQIIITELRRPFHNLQDFEKFGISPTNAELIVVKSGYLSPELAPLASPALMALTDGAVNQDITALTNQHRRMPSYPFQTDSSEMSL